MSNAGVTTYGPFLTADPAAQQAQVDLHVTANLHLMGAAARAISARGAGGIITVSSLAAFGASPGLATYAATKAFLLSFSEALHDELRPHGVVVTCVAPGYTRTDLQRRAGVDASALPDALWHDPGAVVDATLAAHRRGRALVVPGTLNRVMIASARFLPRSTSRRTSARLISRVRPV